MVDGFTSKELSGLLHVSVRPFLLAAVRQRLADREAALLAATLEPQLVIDVLLVLVRHPGALPGEVARRLQNHSPPIRLPQVQAVFDRFELFEGGKDGDSGER